MAGCALCSPATDDDPMAPCGVEALLAMEVSAGATENPYRITCPDPQDGAGESGVGRGENCQRVVGETGHSGLAPHGAEVDAEVARWPAAGRPALVNVPEEPFESCATSAKSGSRDPLEVRKCEADEGRPLGVGVQAQASNRLQLLWPKGSWW